MYITVTEVFLVMVFDLIENKSNDLFALELMSISI